MPSLANRIKRRFGREKAFAEDDEGINFMAPSEILKVIVDPGARRSTHYWRLTTDLLKRQA